MRRVTRNFLLAMAVVGVLLLAMGALPSYLRSGDPYYMTATPVGEVDNGTANATGGTTATPTAATASTENTSVVDAGTLSERRYPYTTEALENATDDSAGQSTAYYRGPVGIKGAFTHSPFDEYDSLAQQYPAAVDGDAVRVSHDGTVYRLAVTQTP
ncbi:hypothetical protein [Haloarcula salinisoli]|uniref:Uncharacterized protein n=1 Tax=Haloarcula salinisoli TaxID=2487746 RepID=A0A8J7YNL3_9EURY|nr:hypothetical protein [Halomicroarcula salinisoli]MBX0287160.1 hypothetical protein [Halomicroarcula salinisoli]MBX0304463.1 hypothetical protein [Halomicroarcula salinisoli]